MCTPKVPRRTQVYPVQAAKATDKSKWLGYSFTFFHDIPAPCESAVLVAKQIYDMFR
jgi:hypothetical protein